MTSFFFIPDYLPPHKDYAGSVSALDRLNMCRLAFGDMNSAIISDMEIRRGGRSYTYITLTELKSEQCEIYLLVGTDMFITLDSWVHPEIIFNIADICYIRRECDEEKTHIIEEKTRQYIDNFKARIHAIDVDVTEISSTELRDSLSSGTALGLISDPVLEYIQSEGLYND